MLKSMLVLWYLVFLFPIFGESLLFRDVTVIDGTGAPAKRLNVLVIGQKIAAIGGKPAVSKSVRVIDGRGKYLIPGMWDMHVHLWESDPMFGLYVANGVTGVRDMGSELERTLRWKREIAAGKRTGPRIFTSGPAIAPPLKNPGKLATIAVRTPAEAQSAVDRIDDGGADFVKILSGLSRDLYEAVAYRARLLRIPFEGHLPDSVTFAEAIQSRQRSLEHLFGLPVALSTEEREIRLDRAQGVALSRERVYSTWSEQKALELFQQAGRYGTWQCPTVTLRERMAGLSGDRLFGDPRVKYVPKKIVATWQDPRADKPTDASKEDFAKCLQIVSWMKKAGSELLAGTDTGDDYVLPGFALHDELKLLVDAGLTPMEALQSATRNPARFFKQEAVLGTVERGKVADLVLLNADPLADIRNTQKIEAVVVRGKMYGRKELDRLLTVQ